ncbi:MAG TPA: hypothetical protein EYG69_05200 [Campylobacterales bacterium]|nr:hypothetical protein [Campylobacterales bacterium]
MSYADVRKNFVFEKEVATHLEEIAKIDGKSMTAVVRDMIEARYKDIFKKEKLKAFYSLKMMPSGSLVGKSIQSIKASMDA